VPICDTTIVVDGAEIAGDVLLDSARRAARGFGALGVGAGDAVALLLRNDIAFLEASFGAALIGALSVPVHAHASTEEIEHVVCDSGARVLVAHADLVPGSLPRVETLVVPVRDSLRKAYRIPASAARVGTNRVNWLDWLDGMQPLRSAAVTMPSSIRYTSGTTGLPKGVRREAIGRRQDQRRAIGPMMDLIGIVPGMRTVVTGPLSHAGPNTHALRAALAGATIVLPARFDAEGLLRLIEDYRITNLNLVPTMFRRLLCLGQGVRNRYDISSLEHVVHGAAPCPRDLKRDMIAWWGPIIHEWYGTTETSALAGCNTEDWLRHPGTVGKPFPIVTLRIVDDVGKELSAGEVGEIVGRVNGLPDFTYQNAEPARRALDRNGLTATGDVGLLDDDGFLFLRGRKKELIIVGGVNIYPLEIETVISTMPAVSDVAVFGIPNDEYGEVVAAAVVPSKIGSPTPEAVRAHVAARLAGFKVPRVVEIRDELPLTASGKVLKRLLRQPYWDRVGRTI
jgi:long-chain acyl-CoA synthetase